MVAVALFRLVEPERMPKHSELPLRGAVSHRLLPSAAPATSRCWSFDDLQVSWAEGTDESALVFEEDAVAMRADGVHHYTGMSMIRRARVSHAHPCVESNSTTPTMLELRDSRFGSPHPLD